MENEIREFARGDDSAYEDWVGRHGGYVLAQRKDGFMLHEASCGHLDLIPGKFSLTARARRWSTNQKPLVESDREAHGEHPAPLPELHVRVAPGSFVCPEKSPLQSDFGDATRRSLGMQERCLLTSYLAGERAHARRPLTQAEHWTVIQATDRSVPAAF